MDKRVYTIEDIAASTRRLMEMEKRPVEAMDSLKWPKAGENIRFELLAQEDRSVRFWLDLAESSRSTTLVVGAEPDRKTKEQVRAGSQQLVRIDIADKREILRHRNPDGSLVIGSHIHLDIDGLGIRWALPLDSQSVVVPDGNGHTVEGMFGGLVSSCHLRGLPRVEFSLGV